MKLIIEIDVADHTSGWVRGVLDKFCRKMDMNWVFPDIGHEYPLRDAMDRQCGHWKIINEEPRGQG